MSIQDRADKQIWIAARRVYAMHKSGTTQTGSADTDIERSCELIRSEYGKIPGVDVARLVTEFIEQYNYRANN